MEEKKANPETDSMENWEEALEETLADSEAKRGEVREGTVLAVKKDGLVVDIGAKRDGFVPDDDLDELEDQEFSEGDTVHVMVTRPSDANGNVELSIAQALEHQDWIKAEKLLESQEVYEATITGSNRGGLTIDFGRIRGFIPMSQLIGFSNIRQAAERYRRLRGMIGEELLLKVIEVNRQRRRLILSQRAAAKEWRAARREDLLEELEAGQVRKGRISQITDFGLFVNLGGLDGLVHISELSWGRIENPGEIYRRGQRVKVKVLNVDRERERIALSIKALKPDPWESVPENYHEGMLVEGKVSQVVDFGVFIELEPGVEGLLHNSELQDMAQRQELESGQTILVKVIRVEADRRRIGLSVRQVRRKEWEDWAAEQAAAEFDLEEEAEEPEAEEEEAAPEAKTEEPPEAEAVEEAEEEAAEAIEETKEPEEEIPEAEVEAVEEAEKQVAEAIEEAEAAEEVAVEELEEEEAPEEAPEPEPEEEEEPEEESSDEAEDKSEEAAEEEEEAAPEAETEEIPEAEAVEETEEEAAEAIEEAEEPEEEAPQAEAEAVEEAEKQVAEAIEEAEEAEAAEEEPCRKKLKKNQKKRKPRKHRSRKRNRKKNPRMKRRTRAKRPLRKRKKRTTKKNRLSKKPILPEIRTADLKRSAVFLYHSRKRTAPRR